MPCRGPKPSDPTRDDELRPTQLLSKGPNGEAPNAPVSEPVLSQDERVSQYAAYVTAATNIVANSGAVKNVYLVKRKRPWGQNGTVWNFGSTVADVEGDRRARPTATRGAPR